MTNMTIDWPVWDLKVVERAVGPAGESRAQQFVTVDSVRTVMKRKEPFVVRIIFHQGRPRTVTEKHCGFALFPVNQPGQSLGPNHQYFFRIPAAHVLVSNAEGINESRAGCIHVHGSAVR